MPDKGPLLPLPTAQGSAVHPDQALSLPMSNIAVWGVLKWPFAGLGIFNLGNGWHLFSHISLNGNN